MVTIVKNKAFKKSYQSQETEYGENYVLKMAGAREKQNRYFENVRCIMDEECRVLVKEVHINNR